MDNESLAQKKQEKRDLRKVANRFGLCFIAMAAIVSVGMTFWGSWINVSKFGRDFFSFFSMIVPFFFMALLSKKSFSEVLSLRKPKDHGVAYFFIGLTCSFLASVISEIIVQLLKLGNISSTQPKSLSEYENTPIGILIFIITTSIFPAIVEEFVFRGVLLGSLKDYGETFAIMVSALTFGLFHGNVEQIIHAFLLGLLLGFVVVKTGSIYISVLIHFANNFRACVGTVLNNNMNYSFITFIVLIISAVPGVVGYFYLRKKDKRAVTFKGLSWGTKMLTLGEKLTCFILTPGMIVFLMFVIYLIANSVKVVSQ